MISSLRGIRWISITFIGLASLFFLQDSGNASSSAQDGIATTVSSFQSVETARWISGFIQHTHGISSTAHFSAPPHKNPYHGFSAIGKSPVTFTSFLFLANPYFSHKIIVRLPHTDLIFPFHFFW